LAGVDATVTARQSDGFQNAPVRPISNRIFMYSKSRSGGRNSNKGGGAWVWLISNSRLAKLELLLFRLSQDFLGYEKPPESRRDLN
jgi:hypothetical protein